MIPEIGNLLLYLLTALCLINFSYLFLQSSLPYFNLLSIRRFILYINALKLFCIGGAFGILIYSFIISDFTVYNVYLNSHTSKPLLFKISAAWGTHEGSLLLWLGCMVFITLFFTIFTEDHKSKFFTIAIQSFITFIFSIYTIFTSNPFARIFPKPIDGLGFNPILQDIGIAFHPPILYFGYVTFSIVFSQALAILICRDYEQNNSWAKIMLPFVLIPWSFLTLGIGLGSWWAYRELGWGGYWFWDPVENASLLPWLIASALIHSLLAVIKTGHCKFWSLTLALMCFIFTISGTFIVRSGLITSVHSFASDPERGLSILFFLSLLLIISVFLLLLRSNSIINIKIENNKLLIFSIIFNNIIFFALASTILFATLYPFALDIFTGYKISVGANYFNTIATPLALIQLLMCIIAVDKSIYKRLISVSHLWQRHKVNFYISLLLTFIIFYLSKSDLNFKIVSIFISLWLFITIIKNYPYYLKMGNYTSCIAHMGFALLILAIAVNSNFQREAHINMQLNKSYDFAHFRIKLQTLNLLRGANYLARNAIFTVSSRSNYLGDVSSEIRVFPVEKVQTTEAGILNRGYYNLYITTGELDEKSGKLMVRVMYQPFINLLWIACFLMFLAGILAIYKRSRTNKIYVET